MRYYLLLSENRTSIKKILFPTLSQGHWFLLEHDLITKQIVSHNSLDIPSDDAPSSDDVYITEEYPTGKQIYTAAFLMKDRPSRAVSIIY